MSDGYSYLDFYRAYGMDDIPHDYSVSEAGWVAVRCPFHEDSHPSAGISLNTGVINCLGCGKSWTTVEYLIEKNGIDPDEAIEVVDSIRQYHDLTVNEEKQFETKQPVLSRHFEALYEQSQEYMSLDRHVVCEYIRVRGISYQTLVDNGIGCLPAGATKWKEEVLVFPYIWKGRVIGLRYRDIASNRGCETKSFFTLGGLDRFEELPDSEMGSKVIIICEGETDRLRTYQAIKNCDLEDFEVVSLPSAVFNRAWARELQGARAVAFIPHDDTNGVKPINSIRSAIPSAEIIRLPFTRQEKSSKDVCDWLRPRSDQQLVDLIVKSIKAKPRKVQTWEEFKESVTEEREWLVDNLLSLNTIFSILGPGKSGKTFLALNLVRSLITGENFLGLEQLTVSNSVEDTRVLFWEEEGAEAEFLERFKWVFQDIPDEIIQEQVFFASHLGLKLDTDEWMEVISKEIEDRNINLIIFDPFSRLYSCNENDAGEMGAVWSRLGSLQNKHKRTSFVIIHHTSKYAAKNIEDADAPLDGGRGSSMTATSVDGGIIMSKHSDKDKMSGLTTKYIKARFEGRFADLTNADGDPVFKLRLTDRGLIIPLTSVDLPIGRGAKLYRLLNEFGGEMTVDQIIKESAGTISKQKIRNYSTSYIDPSTGECLINFDEKTGIASISTVTGF